MKLKVFKLYKKNRLILFNEFQEKDWEFKEFKFLL